MLFVSFAVSYILLHVAENIYAVMFIVMNIHEPFFWPREETFLSNCPIALMGKFYHEKRQWVTLFLLTANILFCLVDLFLGSGTFDELWRPSQASIGLGLAKP